ncbi:MAG TPA: hypothetical protein VGK19_05665 [Capsulimonadaceae bacterium]|jgi:hypothetical protein
MPHDKTTATNEHLKNNASSEPADEVRQRRRLAELEAQHAKDKATAASGTTKK